MPKTKTTIIT